MKGVYRKMLVTLLVIAVWTTAAGAQGVVAEHAIRARAAGIDLIIYPMNVKDVVTVLGLMPLGDAHRSAQNPALAELTQMMIEQGTVAHDKFALSETLTSLGARLETKSAEAYLQILGKSLKQDMSTVVGLMAEELRTPAFSPDEFAKVKTQLAAGYQQAVENELARAYETMTRAVFPRGSPNLPVSFEHMLKAINVATLDEVKAFHKKYYGPMHMTLVFVGDVDAHAVKAAVTQAFGGWSGGVDIDRSVSENTLAPPGDQKIALKDKASVRVLLGQATGLRVRDPDYLPLSVGTAILGSGFTGRLMSTVRVKEGLTYGINSELFGSEFSSGGFMIGSNFAPELLEKGVASTRRELDRWWRQGITAEELDARKKSLAGEYAISLGQTGGMAYQILQTVEYGVSIDWVDQYPQKIAALTVEQVNEAITKYLDPQKMVLVEVGTFTKP
jgi:zinc protease